MTPEPAHPQLLAEIAAYCEATGMSRSAFGACAMNDPSFVSDLEAGRECRQRTITRVRRFMESGQGEADDAKRSAA